MTGVRLPEINTVVLSGRVVRDGEVFVTAGGTMKLTLRVAVNRRVKDSKTSEWKDDAFYIDVILWKEQAERGKERAKKGVPIVVEGRLSGREYEDKSGQKRSVTEVVANRVQFLSIGETPRGEGSPAGVKQPAAAGGEEDLEEVPF